MITRDSEHDDSAMDHVGVFVQPPEATADLRDVVRSQGSAPFVTLTWENRTERPCIYPHGYARQEFSL